MAAYRAAPRVLRKDFISAMLSADENETFACAITVDHMVIGRTIFIGKLPSHLPKIKRLAEFLRKQDFNMREH